MTQWSVSGVYREIVPAEKLVFRWGATDGWPKLDPERLDESPLVTVTLAQRGESTELTVRVQLPPDLPDDGVPEWWPMVRGGMRDTVDRLVAALTRTPSGR